MDFSGESGGSKALGTIIPFAAFFCPFITFAYFYCKRLGTDKETVEPIEPDLSKGGMSPTLCCGDGMGSCIFTKPEEYFESWFWTQVIYTWPNTPRGGEPKLTRTDRITVAILVVVTDLVLYLVCSYGLSRFGVESSFVDDDTITSTAAGDSSAVSNATASNSTGVSTPVPVDVPVEATGQLGFLTVCLISGAVSLLEAVIQWIIMTLFGIVQKLKMVNYSIGTITMIITLVYFSFCYAFFIVVACEMTCSGLAANLLIPYGMGFPIGCVLIYAGPYLLRAKIWMSSIWICLRIFYLPVLPSAVIWIVCVWNWYGNSWPAQVRLHLPQHVWKWLIGGEGQGGV